MSDSPAALPSRQGPGRGARTAAGSGVNPGATLSTVYETQEKGLSESQSKGEPTERLEPGRAAIGADGEKAQAAADSTDSLSSQPISSTAGKPSSARSAGNGSAAHAG